MPSLTLNAVLNIASGAIVTICILVGARADLMRLFLFLYALLFVVLLVVNYGGQINAALALTVVCFELLELLVPAYKRTSYSTTATNQYTKVFSGVMHLGAQRNNVFHTYDTTSATYTPLPRSVNRTGGSQFTYSFWLRIAASKLDDELINKTLLLRGDLTKYTLPSTTCPDYSALVKKTETDVGDYLVMCPRIYFTSARSIGVAVNTDTKMIKRFDCGNATNDPARAKNMLTMLYGKFAMLTFSFEDNVDITEFEKGIRMSMYVNGELYITKTARGALRVNNGNLYVSPEEMADRFLTDVYMADLVYFNYALSDLEVKALYMLGHSNDDWVGKNKAGTDLVLSPYNPIDRYNTDWRTITA